jgi:hypothetical protein
MGIACETVWRETSNYVDGTVSPQLQLAMDEHITTCKRCASVVDGVRNVVMLYGDDRMAELPAGFSQRLQRKLETNMPKIQTRRNFFGWGLAFAASVLVAGGIELSRHDSHQKTEVGSKTQGHQAKPVPPDLEVIIADQGRHFHLAGCAYLVNYKTLHKMKAKDAIQSGHSPCPRCLSEYV